MKRLFSTLLLAVVGTGVHAQGCSDAGFCSIGNLGHSAPTENTRGMHYLKLTLPAGLGDDDVFVFSPGLEYGYSVGRWQLSGKLTGNYASGILGSAAGAGDVFLSATYALPASKGWQSSFTLGTKLPLNQSNLKEDGLSLPMQYQSSLGTVDLITGIAISSEKWKVAAGWQQPLTGINRNNFLPQYWSEDKAAAYPPTNDFNRKGDVLLRTSYRVFKKAEWSLEGGLLAIYHLGDDTYIDANISNAPIAIQGSQGLTLNITASLDIELNKRWSLGIIAGVPLVVRDVRPDGLTRSFVVAPQITYNF
ncbi:hypothetical protein ACX0G7_11540 [Flavitalea antarctica]